MPSISHINASIHKLLSHGARLRTSDDERSLAWAKLENNEKDYRLTLLSKKPGSRLSSSHCYAVSKYDLDQSTGKVYLVIAPEEYIQLFPVSEKEVCSKQLKFFQHEYLYLTNELLPQRARRQNWVVEENHCLQRLLLDHLFQDCWYRHLDRGRIPAYRQLDGARLGHLLFHAHQLLFAQPNYVEKLNRNSLEYRTNLD